MQILIGFCLVVVGPTLVGYGASKVAIENYKSKVDLENTVRDEPAGHARPRKRASSIPRRPAAHSRLHETSLTSPQMKYLKSYTHIQAEASRESVWVGVWLFLLFLASVFVIMMLAKNYPPWLMRFPSEVVSCRPDLANRSQARRSSLLS
jgi:hypothetical protein